MEKLVDKLKIVFGRKLTPEQMKSARIRGENEGLKIIAGSDKPLKKIDGLEKHSSGEFVRFRQKFEYMATPDASEGWSRVHRGYYPSKTILEVYDGDGLLKFKEVSDRNLYTSGMGDTHSLGWGSTTRTVFEPHGSFRGKKIDLGDKFIAG